MHVWRPKKSVNIAMYAAERLLHMKLTCQIKMTPIKEPNETVNTTAVAKHDPLLFKLA